MKDDDREKFDKLLFPIRVSASQLEQIRKRADEAGFTLSEYGRRMLTRGKIVARKPRIEMEALVELRRIGVNLNQLTKSGHIHGAFDRAALQSTLVEMDRLMTRLMGSGD